MTPLQAAVVAEALSWVNTPYHHAADIKGVGVDCAMLLVRVYASCGLIPADTDPRPYASDWNLHQSDQLFLGWLQQYATEQPMQGPARAGDVQVYHYGQCYSHGAICLGDGRMVHAVRKHGQVLLGREDNMQLTSRPVKRFRLQGLEA